MTTNEAFLHALNHEKIKDKYPASSIRTWRSRALRDKLSLDFMVEFLSENGYKVQQAMRWEDLDGGKYTARQHSDQVKPANEGHLGKDYKAQLNKKLYSVRKQLNAELLNKWYEWCRVEYKKDFPQKKAVLSPVVFSQMTYGRYISKENIPFAVKALKEGKKILHDYHDFIKREVESL